VSRPVLGPTQPHIQ